MSLSRVSFTDLVFTPAMGNNAPELVRNIYATDHVAEVSGHARRRIDVAADVSCCKRTAYGRTGSCGVC